jgi:predicted enzyme related to lactoylglutathione lyase
MSTDTKPEVGRITWVDLTVPEASRVRDFYAEVIGWRPSPVDMGGYDDYNMLPPTSDQPVAGVCHARGMNQELPAQWLVYVTVADVDRAAAACTAHGGEVVVAPRSLGGGRFCVIRDPAGAVLALYAETPS